MGGNPGAVGNGLSHGLQLPPTEFVADVRKIERAMLFSQIPGQRNWEDVLGAAFKADYPNPQDLATVVAKSVERIRKKFVPIRIMDRYREDERQNFHAMGK